MTTVLNLNGATIHNPIILFLTLNRIVRPLEKNMAGIKVIDQVLTPGWDDQILRRFRGYRVLFTVLEQPIAIGYLQYNHPELYNRLVIEMDITGGGFVVR